MPVPANLASIELFGDARALLGRFVPGDTTETGFKIAFSFDNGSSWEDDLLLPAGVTQFDYHSPPQNVTAKFRVTPTNASGDASTSTSTAAVIGVLPEVASQTDVWIVIGEDPATPMSINSSALTAYDSGNAAALAPYAALIKKYIDDESEFDWEARNNPAKLPILNAKGYIWDHVGGIGTITSIAPNTPTTGVTEVTFSGSINRQVGHQFYARFRSTGVSNMDNLELKVEVTASNKVKIASFTAASSASTGTMDLPYFASYDETQNAETDFRALGFTPTRTWSFERTFLAMAQDSRCDIAGIGDNTNTPSLMQRIISPSPLVSKLVGAGTSTRWSKERSGKSWSQWDVMVRIMEDGYAFATTSGASSMPSPYVIRGIVITAGYNEVSSNVAQVRASSLISSVAVGGGGTVTVTCSSSHGCSDVSGQLYTVAKFSGIGGTLGDALNGKHFPIHVTSTTAFEIVDFDGTGLTGTVASGTTAVETGAPIYFFQELLSDHIDNAREAAIAAWHSTQDPEDIPVLLMQPGYDRWEDALEVVIGDPTRPSRLIAYAEFASAMRALAGSKVNVKTQSLQNDRYTHTRNGSLISGIFFSSVGTKRIGVDAYNIITGAEASSSTKPTPCVVGVILGDSYVQGTSPYALGSLRDPEVISPEDVLAGGLGEPIPWLKVYNMGTEAIEQVVVDPTLDISYGGRSNLSTHPTLNIGQIGRAGVQVAAARELRLAFPDNDIVLFNLGVDGSTMTPHANVIGTTGARIKSITTGVTTTTIELETSTNGGTRIYRTKPFNVLITGVTGLTPSIDGTRLATPVDMSTNPITRGTQKFSIPVGTSGTAAFTSATVAIPAGIWDPAAGDIWAEVEDQVPKFLAALTAANYIPDSKFVLTMIGTNDCNFSAVSGITPTAYTAAVRRFVAAVREQFTTRAEPADDLPIVFLAPIKHGRATVATSTITSFQSALASAVSGDARVAILNVDENPDRLIDAVVMDADGVHPSTPGYVALGLRLARKLASIPTWDAVFDTSVGGSGTGGVVEVVTP